eukprot:TRINITY_DN57677_c0_g1_i1.p1 TRINITY_DN57677_c0_g1~~TRINITY_DN57677_c0_g1_i1.p1  ORF type:complete len:558 (-),score=28.81 TRINITY_DN57677_c0_g1_i1:772-2445(-)
MSPSSCVADFEYLPPTAIVEHFDQMGLSPDLLRSVYAYGFEKPSMIQSRALKPICAGRDAILTSQSGTGRSALVAVAMVQQLEQANKNFVKFNTVNTPTSLVAGITHDKPKEHDTGPICDIPSRLHGGEGEILVLCQTREVAIDLQHVYKGLAQPIPSLTDKRNFTLCIGGERPPRPTRWTPQLHAAGDVSPVTTSGIKTLLCMWTHLQNIWASIPIDLVWDVFSFFEIRRHQSWPRVVHATPGRALMEAQRGFIGCKGFDAIVFDEVDGLLCRGFNDQLSQLMDYVNADAQIIVTSPTLSAEADVFIRHLFCFPTVEEPSPPQWAQTWRDKRSAVIGYTVEQLQAHVEANLTLDHNDKRTKQVEQLRSDIQEVSGRRGFPCITRIRSESLTLEGIKQYYIALDKEEWKLDTLNDLFETIDICQSVIYCNSRRKVEWLTGKLQELGYSCIGMHGEMPVDKRNQALQDFRSGSARMLILTDMMFRSPVDVAHVSLTLQWDLPRCKEAYLHRIGRSGRFGRKGVTIMFVTPDDVPTLKALEEFYYTHVDELPMDIADLL